MKLGKRIKISYATNRNIESYIKVNYTLAIPCNSQYIAKAGNQFDINKCSQNFSLSLRIVNCV